MNLLNSKDPNAKEVFNIVEGYTQAFMLFGYTEDEAKARAGAYVGSMYIAGGMSAVVASGALAKQFGKDMAQGAKPGSSMANPIESATNSSETYFRVEGGAKSCRPDCIAREAMHWLVSTGYLISGLSELSVIRTGLKIACRLPY